MRRHGIECWVLISREYAEDPVAQTMLPATWMSSRRRTILAFLDTPNHRERLAVTRYQIDGLFPDVSVWTGETRGPLPPGTVDGPIQQLDATSCQGIARRVCVVNPYCELKIGPRICVSTAAGFISSGASLRSRRSMMVLSISTTAETSSS